MIINVSQLLVKPRKFRDSLFFALILALFLTWAYRLGANEDASQVALVVQLGFITLALAYGAYAMLVFQRAFKQAEYLYRQYLEGLPKSELIRILQHPTLTERSRRIVEATFQRRFPSRRR